jgi:hypothetical protein
VNDVSDAPGPGESTPLPPPPDESAASAPRAVAVVPRTCPNGHTASGSPFCPECGAAIDPPAPETQTQPAPGWWLASDGNWYPPETASHVQRPFASPNATHTKLVVILVSTALVIAAVVSVLIVTNGSSPTVSATTNPAPSTIAIPNGPSLPSLTSSVQAQIVGTGTDNFNVTGVDSVICNPPDSWKPGATFTCYAYGPTKSEVGEYDGTIEPNASDGGYQWNARWIAS